MAFARVLVRLCLVKASIRPHSTPLPTAVRPRDAFSAFQDLPQPRSVAATPRTDLSNATEPCILTGLVDAFEGIPDDLLTNTGGKVRVDVWPVDGGPCPAKAGGVIIGPTLVPVAADRVLPLLRHKQRGYHAYIRHLDLNSFPDVAARLPLKRAKQLCGPRIKSANLWLGDGRVRSAVHWDGHDNLLLQLEAVWKSTSASGAPDNFHEVILGDDAAVLAPSSGEEPTPPRHRAGVAATVEVDANAP